VRFDGSPVARQALALRLETAGCEVDKKGTDWLDAGDFQVKQNEVESSHPLASTTTVDDSLSRTKFVDPELHVKLSPSGDARYRFVVTNRGPGPVRSLFVNPNEDAPLVMFDEELPLDELAEGDSVMIPAALIAQATGAQEVTVQLSATLESGRAFERVATVKL